VLVSASTTIAFTWSSAFFPKTYAANAIHNVVGANVERIERPFDGNVVQKIVGADLVGQINVDRAVRVERVDVRRSSLRTPEGVVGSIIRREKGLHRAKAQHLRQVFHPSRAIAEMPIGIGRERNHARRFREKVPGVRKAVAERKNARIGGGGGRACDP
jgi:hypothetical protein